MKGIIIFFILLPCFLFAQVSHTINVGGTSISTGISKNIVSLSTKGILSDANLDTGQTSFGTNQTSAIQAILNTASKTNPLIIIWDVKASCTGLKIKSYTTINALFGCGAILRDNSDNPLLANYNWTANNNIIVDSNITINGGTWAGNGWRGGVNMQANNTHLKGQITIVNFFGAKNVRLENCTFLNSSSWCIAFITSENIYINNCVIDDGAVGQKIQDGIDFLGYAKKIRIFNNYIRNGDDKITLCPNSTGGINGAWDHSVYTGVDGDESNIIIDGNYFEKQGKGFAFYCGGGNYLYDVAVSNNYGYSQSLWLGMWNADYLTGYTITTGTKWPYGLKFLNNHINVYSYVGYGSTSFPLAVLSCSANDITFRDCITTDYSVSNPCFAVYNSGSTAITVNSLTFDNYQSVIPATLGQVVDQIQVLGSSTTIGRLSIVNSNIDINNSGNGDRGLLNIQAGTVKNVFLSDIRYNAFKTMFKNAGTITNMVASNITENGLNTGGDIGFVNTGTITNSAFSNVICKQLLSGSFGNVDSTTIIQN